MLHKSMSLYVQIFLCLDFIFPTLAHPMDYYLTWSSQPMKKPFCQYGYSTIIEQYCIRLFFQVLCPYFWIIKQPSQSQQSVTNFDDDNNLVLVSFLLTSYYVVLFQVKSFWKFTIWRTHCNLVFSAFDFLFSITHLLLTILWNFLKIRIQCMSSTNMLYHTIVLEQTN